MRYVFFFSECGCDENGSDGNGCNEDGVCTCKPNVDGDKCDKCKPNFFQFPSCKAPETSGRQAVLKHENWHCLNSFFL